MNANAEPIDSLAEAYSNCDTPAQHGATVLQRSKERLMLDMKAVVDDAQALFKEAMDTSAEGIAAVRSALSPPRVFS